jgi:hypothetical protein
MLIRKPEAKASGFFIAKNHSYRNLLVSKCMTFVLNNETLKIHTIVNLSETAFNSFPPVAKQLKCSAPE